MTRTAAEALFWCGAYPCGRRGLFPAGSAMMGSCGWVSVSALAAPSHQGCDVHGGEGRRWGGSAAQIEGRRKGDVVVGTAARLAEVSAKVGRLGGIAWRGHWRMAGRKKENRCFGIGNSAFDGKFASCLDLVLIHLYYKKIHN